MSTVEVAPNHVVLLVTNSSDLKNQVEESLLLNGRDQLRHLTSLDQAATKMQAISPTLLLIDWAGIAAEKTTLLHFYQYIPTVSIILLTENDPGWDFLALAALGAHDYLPISDINPSMLARVLRYAERYQRREKQVQQLADAIPVPLMITSRADGEVLFMNARQSQVYGITPDYLLGQQTVSFYDDPQERTVLLQQLERDGWIQGLEVKGKPSPHGQPSVTAVWVSPTTFRGQDALISVTVDMTEQRAAEAALRESEERFRRTLDNMLEGCQIIGFDWRYLYLNDSAARHGRQPKEDLLGRTIIESYPGIENTEMYKVMQQCMAERTATIAEFEFTYPDGDRSWFEFSIQPEAGGIFILTLDITERKKAELALRQSEERFGRVFRTSPIAKSISRLADGRFVDVNESFLKLFGYGRDELIGHTSTELNLFVQPDERAEPIRLLHQQGFVREYEMLMQTKSGDIRRMLFSSEMIELDAEPHAIAIIQDITEQKRVEEQLLYQANLLQHVSDAIIATDLNLNITTWNEAATALYGWPATDVIGKPISILKTTYTDTPREEVIRMFVENEIWQGEVIQAHMEGAVIHVLSSVSMVKNSDGLPIGPIAVNRDITNRKLAEKALQDSQARLNGIIESAMDAIISVDEQERILFFNMAAVKMFGCTVAEALGQPIDRFIPEGFRQVHHNHIRLFGETGITNRAMGALGTISGQRLSGEEFPIEASISQIEANGQKLYTVILRDITERIMAEAQLTESQDFAQATIDALSAHICVLDEQGVILTVNRAWQEFAQANSPTPPDYFVGANYLEVCDTAMGPHSDEAAPFAAGLRAIIQDDLEGFVWEYPCDAPWEKRWFIARITRFSRHNSLRLVVAHENITDRKQAEEAMAWSERKFRNLFENAPVGMYRLKVDGSVVLEVNTKVREILELPKETILADPGSIHFADMTDWSFIFDQFQMHNRVIDYETHIRTKSGIKTCLISATLYPEEGVVEGTLLDISHRKQAEAEILDLNRNLERRVEERTVQMEVANKELEAFAYSVSHDLRAPLRAMNGFSRILMQDYSQTLDVSGQHYLQRISDNARQMGTLIDDLLKFSRLSREPIQRETVNVTAVVRRVLADLNLESTTPEIDIVVDELPPCQADRQLLYQVFLNLIENAVKYSSHREVVHIHVGVQETAETAVPPSAVVYFIQDNGIGFDMAYADKVFGVFQRLQPAEEYEGTGVGLALVQRIIHRHNGRIWVMAAIDQGATFYFTVGSPPPESLA